MNSIINAINISFWYVSGFLTCFSLFYLNAGLIAPVIYFMFFIFVYHIIVVMLTKMNGGNKRFFIPCIEKWISKNLARDQ